VASQAEIGGYLAVVSTGLVYLLVPIFRNLRKARIAVENLEEIIREFGAKFFYAYDVAKSEGRTWDNKGVVEDIATGSAAGPVAAYLCRHGVLKIEHELHVKQGRFVGRPSVMIAKVLRSGGEPGHVEVSGPVRLVATGSFD
jgi:PhzF family phenazine biosynthesis protein